MVQLPSTSPNCIGIVQTHEGGRFASELSFTLNHIETSTPHAPIEEDPLPNGGFRLTINNALVYLVEHQLVYTTYNTSRSCCCTSMLPKVSFGAPVTF